MSIQVSHSRVRAPASLSKTVDRQRLLTLLDACVESPVTLLSAPAGYGKTVLLSAWSRGVDREGAGTRSVAWVSLTTDDNDPRTFCSAILASLDDCNAPGWRGPDRAGRSPGELDLLAEVIDALDALSGTLVLVLDDVHLLTAPAPLRAIARLIRHRPGCLRLVLSARCDPPVHIARLRAEGQLAEIRAEHLRFRPAEAAELLCGAGLDVDAEQVTVMLDRTEGWAAALRLIAVGLRDRRDADEVRRFLDELHVTDRSLTDYLASEVLDGLAADVRDVLRRVSICDRLSPSLAVTLTGRADASDVLRRVERATSLVTWFGGRDKEYRIHPLLRAYLQADLEREHPDTARALRVVAAGWYEARGALVTAAAYARRSGDASCAKEFLSRNGTVLLGAGKHGAVQAALRALGEPHIASEPRLSLISALANLTVGQLTAAAVDRDRASLAPVDGPRAPLRVLVDAQRALLTGGPLPAELRVIPADGGPQTADGGEADGVEEVWLTAARGSAAARTGDRRAARRELDRADALARACGYPAVRVQVLVGLAGLDGAEGDHRGMAARAAAAVELAADHGLGASPWLGAAHRMLAGPAAQSRPEQTCPERDATVRSAAALTDRESIVLRRLCSQRSLDEIAGDLTVSPNTVKTHVRAIYGKLGARSRRQAVAIAQRRGMV